MAPALFVGHDRGGCLFGIICVHADDMLIAFGAKNMQDLVKNMFPFDNWEEPPLVFCGKVEIDDHGRTYTGQKVFAQKPEPLALSKDRKWNLGGEATKVEIAENRNVLGVLGWLCTCPPA